MHFTNFLLAAALALIPTAMASPREVNIMACCCGTYGPRVLDTPIPGLLKDGKLTPKGAPPAELSAELSACVSPPSPWENDRAVADFSGRGASRREATVPVATRAPDRRVVDGGVAFVESLSIHGVHGAPFASPNQLARDRFAILTDDKCHCEVLHSIPRRGPPGSSRTPKQECTTGPQSQTESTTDDNRIKDTTGDKKLT
jgi:hypothetical protein